MLLSRVEESPVDADLIAVLASLIEFTNSFVSLSLSLSFGSESLFDLIKEFTESILPEITSIVDFNESRDIFPLSRVEIILSQILSLFTDISSEDVLSTVAAIFVISATKLEFTSV